MENNQQERIVINDNGELTEPNDTERQTNEEQELNDCPPGEESRDVDEVEAVHILVHHPAFAARVVRQQSFEQNCPVCIQTLTPQFVDEACDSGFFYTGKADFLCCYVCDVKICDWRESHLPAEEHWRHQPLCPLTYEPQRKLQNKCVSRTVEQKLLDLEAEERFQLKLEIGYVIRG